MPYPNEHACRLKPPGGYDKIRRVNCDQKHDGKCIDVIYGIKEGKSEIQALRFKTNIWTADAARAVCKDRGGTFEPAAKKKSSETEIERRFIPQSMLRLQRADDKPDTLVGYAAVFNKLSEPLFMNVRERIEPGAFKKSIKKDDIRALVDHDSSMLLARNKSGTLKLKEDNTGLHTIIDLPETQLARDISQLIERGDLSGMSFGFRTVSDSWETVDEQEIRILKEVKLFDVSVVTFPAYPDTTIVVRSHIEWKESQMEIVENEANWSKERARMYLELVERE